MAVYKLADGWWGDAINELAKGQCKGQNNATQKRSVTREKRARVGHA